MSENTAYGVHYPGCKKPTPAESKADAARKAGEYNRDTGMKNGEARVVPIPKR